MISFIQANLNILIFIFLLLLTIDSFLLLNKYRKYIESLPNLIISYDIFKSYFINAPNYYENNLIIVYLTLKNLSTTSLDIVEIKLIDESNSYSAIIPEVRDKCYKNEILLINDDEADPKTININILSENILMNKNISSHNDQKGYVVFENLPEIVSAKNYKLVIEVSGKTKKAFEKDITINPIDTEFHAINEK
ncbi:hypothetical protein B0P06_004065 [Clostridium saccharoperbutylacetonicum]|uniref:DUF4352 domain-containing protein n=1 Tax=Clostridium saccharoperbutylacetonicum N1-4(HMT) TaxID=931276 RepID=M1N2D1_9CLOT|nr:hypothetical protein [Clostridium saccharoperbutylacetonicum]AGF57632.1 hypothetical protein Cspa_c38720 [Clostridium saccharoperbutylacetonicum N1-4(HMT)]NRT61600.1 hypothetical protein [Clostridium saccharoperbutylacetonicum]NSB24923.1 hypothetical protein [Clostridium saccharoperbutylacetonicum]NSB44294.1 hypothetical protein [Clostridium saccharoperbutylacetonicum]